MSCEWLSALRIAKNADNSVLYRKIVWTASMKEWGHRNTANRGKRVTDFDDVILNHLFFFVQNRPFARIAVAGHGFQWAFTLSETPGIWKQIVADVDRFSEPIKVSLTDSRTFTSPEHARWGHRLNSLVERDTQISGVGGAKHYSSRTLTL